MELKRCYLLYCEDQMLNPGGDPITTLLVPEDTFHEYYRTVHEWASILPSEVQHYFGTFLGQRRDTEGKEFNKCILGREDGPTFGMGSNVLVVGIYYFDPPS